jgi:Ca-activated chloride channel family protein
MNFLWQEALWLLLLLPVLVAGYVWLLKRRKKTAVAWSSLSIVKEAMGNQRLWRRHVPPVLMLLSLATLIVAGARPTAVITLPLVEQTVILAMDVSGSMRATDVEPNRLVASQNAAKAFIAELPRTVRVGVVSFAGTAAIVQPPTLSREDVVAAIDRFQLQRATAIGSGLILSLAAIFPDAGIDLSQVTGARTMPRALGEQPKEKEFTPVEPGSYASAAIILLTDGQRTTGPDSMDAARMAADRGVKVYTVGIGTKEGDTIGFDGSPAPTRRACWPRGAPLRRGAWSRPTATASSLVQRRASRCCGGAPDPRMVLPVASSAAPVAAQDAARFLARPAARCASTAPSTR